MATLVQLVSQEDMISVTVDGANIVRVIQMLNDRLKEQDRRIAELESRQQALATKADLGDCREKIDEMSKTINGLSEKENTDVERLQSKMDILKAQLNEDVERRFNEALITANTAAKSVGSGLGAEIESLKAMVRGGASGSEDLQKQTKALGDKVAHLHSELMKDRNENVIARVDEMINEKLGKLQESIGNAVAAIADKKKGPNDDQFEQLWAISNQNRTTLMNALAELSMHGRKIDVLMKAVDAPMPEIVMPAELPPSPRQEPMRGFESTVADERMRREHRELASTVDGLGDRMNTALQDITSIKNAMNRNEKDVRDVVMAIIDEFKLIRGNASGLENLPPLNLAGCVPSFFNNPSFTFSREEASSCSSSCTTERSIRNSVSNERLSILAEAAPLGRIDEEPSAPHVRRVSGLMHLVCRSENLKRAMALDQGGSGSLRDFKLEEEEGEEEEEEEARETEKVEEEEKQETEEKSSSRRTRRSSRDDSANTRPLLPDEIIKLKMMLNTFLGEKDKLMSAVDRKVDRDMVERLFNKFRTIIMGLNDKVTQLSSLLGKFATQQDVDAVAKAVSHIPYGPEKAGAVKLGPECICCGRAKTALTGQVSASTAIRGGGITVNVQTPNNGSSTFLYGDGGAYRGSLIDSFPHFKLPSLSK